MPMKPEAKAKQKAQQEARWAKDRGEAAPTPTQFDEPEMPIGSQVKLEGSVSSPEIDKALKESMKPAPAPKKPAAKKAATKKAATKKK